jgi:hypothetical protein
MCQLVGRKYCRIVLNIAPSAAYSKSDKYTVETGTVHPVQQRTATCQGSFLHTAVPFDDNSAGSRDTRCLLPPPFKPTAVVEPAASAGAETMTIVSEQGNDVNAAVDVAATGEGLDRATVCLRGGGTRETTGHRPSERLGYCSGQLYTMCTRRAAVRCCGNCLNYVMCMISARCVFWAGGFVPVRWL